MSRLGTIDDKGGFLPYESTDWPQVNNSAWNLLIADLERRRDEIQKAIDAVRACRKICERPVQVDLSRAPILRQLLSTLPLA